MDNKLISIIIPFYNSEAYLEKAILSVLNQSYKNIELILVNDGSKDNSEEIVKKYLAKDKRIKLISKPNGGYSTAINAGLDNLSIDSDYFLFMGSDDELYPDALEKIITKSKGKALDLIGFETKIYYEDGSTIDDEESFINHDIYEENIDVVSFYNKHLDIYNEHQLFFTRDTSRLYKTSLLKDLRYFGKYGVSSDGIFSMLFAYRCHSFAHLDIYGYKWNLRKNSVSQSKPNELKIEDKFLNWKKFFEIVVINDYKFTKKQEEYIDSLINTLISMLWIKDKEIYARNKKNIKEVRKLIKVVVHKFNYPITDKQIKFILKHPKIYRLLKKNKH